MCNVFGKVCSVNALEKVCSLQRFWKKCAVCNVFGKSVQCATFLEKCAVCSVLHEIGAMQLEKTRVLGVSIDRAVGLKYNDSFANMGVKEGEALS